MNPADLSDPPPMPEAPGRWLDRFLAWRDRTVASRRFQRWASAFPLTRGMARSRANGLFDLMAGFVYSQVLLACVRLDLFERLADGPQTAAALSERVGMPEPALQKLLVAAVSLKLVEHRGQGRFGLGPLGAPIVGNAAITSMVEHHAELYADLRDPVALLRSTPGSAALARYWPYVDPSVTDGPASLGADRVATYSALMSASQPLVADEVLAAYSFTKHRCLLDVGGGEGRFVAAVAAQAPQLQLKVFDLPAVVDRARERLAEQGLAGRATVTGGDFFRDELPGGADVVSLIRVLFDHDDARVLMILRAARRALPADGTLLVAEPMSGTPGAEAMGDAYFGFYLLAMGRGRPRTAQEIGDLMRQAGFTRVRLLDTRMPLQTRLMVGHPA